MNAVFAVAMVRFCPRHAAAYDRYTRMTRRHENTTERAYQPLSKRVGK